MTAVDAPPRLVSQLARFVLIGGFCALVDFGVYQGLLALDLWVHLAKAVSFVAGTTTAFFLNRRFTFAAGRGGVGQVGGFALLYTVTFFVNVGVNALMLHLLPSFSWRITVAWVVAQGVATVINFVMLRTVVFRVR
ncbi:GtrA family protein [Actinophytocola algeriensis]|uniref:Putative flippase GtrA n=1 Tax=Actinophytocola algeriensis TaxID=1768010 RepID=A0A7W7Q4Z3_9PSEU|nr:GtrA family protein [Actinophytocola algeriensis]MBB4906933.1 putative flippase GtrA [Actinophytocola algeriensis]MBE1478415.1 putative flippase GtrA [Actinophytocola algeriensis]